MSAPANPMPFFGANDRCRLAEFAESQGRLLGRRRRASLPPPTDCCIEESANNMRGLDMRKRHVACAVLQKNIDSALFNLHSVEDSIAFWDPKAELTHPRKMYYMTFERGPKALAEMAGKALWQLKSPYRFLLESAYGMNDLITLKLNALTAIQNCLAAFLAETFSLVEGSRIGCDENSVNQLFSLFTIVNTLYQKLGPALKSVLSKDPEEFGTVQLIDIQWTVDLSMDAINLVYKNIQILDSSISSELFLHGKPRNVTMYWLPYTCGTIALVGCSIWLLRNSSLEGTKQMLTGLWNSRVKKPVNSIRNELTDSLNGDDGLDNRREEVSMMEASVHRSLPDAAPLG